MSSPVCPTVKITVWQPASVSRDATLSEGVTKPCATVSHPSVSSVSACQGGVRIQNPVVFSFHHQPPPHSLLLPLLLHSSTLASCSTLAGWLAGWLAAEPRRWWMRCFLTAMSKCAARTHGACEEDVAGRRPVSPFIHTRQTVWARIRDTPQSNYLIIIILLSFI